MKKPTSRLQIINNTFNDPDFEAYFDSMIAHKRTLTDEQKKALHHQIRTKNSNDDLGALELEKQLFYLRTAMPDRKPDEIVKLPLPTLQSQAAWSHFTPVTNPPKGTKNLIFDKETGVTYQLKIELLLWDEEE